MVYTRLPFFRDRKIHTYIYKMHDHAASVAISRRRKQTRQLKRRLLLAIHFAQQCAHLGGARWTRTTYKNHSMNQ
jgi:hypothetical protein